MFVFELELRETSKKTCTKEEICAKEKHWNHSQSAKQNAIFFLTDDEKTKIENGNFSCFLESNKTIFLFVVKLDSKNEWNWTIFAFEFQVNLIC